VTFNSIDFSISSTPTTQTIKPGEAASYVLHFVPVGGNFLPGISLSRSGLPLLAGCIFNPGSIAAGSGAIDVTLTISTTGPNLAGLAASAYATRGLLLFLPLIAVIACLGGTRKRHHPGAMLLVVVVFVTLAISLQACGGGASTGGGNPPPPAPVSVSISPSAASVAIGQSKQFQANVFGSSDTRVTWQVNNASGGDSALGTIDSNGLYTAPAAVPNPAVVSVVAVSVADSTRNASAAVNVISSMSITVSPATASVALGGTQQFVANVSGTANTAVAWSVNGKTGGDSTGGTISATGLYTAPAAVPNPPTVIIAATSLADWRQQASAKVSIASVAVAVHPTSASVYTNSQQQFTATVTGSTNTRVNWNVNGILGGNATIGTINAAGLYTAPASVPTPSSVTVSAISQADTSKKASATVTVLPSTPFGTYTITVAGTSGSLSRTRNVTLVVGP
jgi:hypothetical protein